MTFTSGSNFEVEIGGPLPGNNPTDHDQLNVTGTVDLGGATLTTLPYPAMGGYVPQVGDSYVIIANDDIDPVTGTFAGLPNDGDVISTNFLDSGLTAVINYDCSAGACDGNDVAIDVQAATPLNTPTISAVPVIRTAGRVARVRRSGP